MQVLLFFALISTVYTTVTFDLPRAKMLTHQKTSKILEKSLKDTPVDHEQEDLFNEEKKVYNKTDAELDEEFRERNEKALNLYSKILQGI